ncbi:MAG TPA: hypothetical protein VFC53_02720 [Dehalococcoidia bacterium]|nr:hypothetical protein [Dehalococcoidia bacterium]
MAFIRARIIAALTVGLVAAMALGAGVASAQQQGVPWHEGTRVEVQLAVFGLAAFVVVVVGLGAYVLRKKLGLVAPPPEQPTGGHH